MVRVKAQPKDKKPFAAIISKTTGLPVLLPTKPQHYG